MGREESGDFKHNHLCKSGKESDVAFDLDTGKQFLKAGIQNIRKRGERDVAGYRVWN